MHKKICVKVLLYNIINSILFFFASIFSTLEFFYSLKTTFQIIVVVFFAFVSGILYFLYLYRIHFFSKIIHLFIIDTVFFVIFTVLTFSLYNSSKTYLPIVEMNSAYGLWIMMLSGIYLVISSILKLCVLIYFFVEKIRKGSNTGDGSLC